MRKQCVPGVSPPPSQTPGYEAKQREDRLQQQRQAMKDNYDTICSENRQLMHCLPGSRKTRKRGARDKAALKEARDKARVEEEERQAVRDKYDEATTRHAI